MEGWGCTHSVVAQQGAEVGGLLLVHQLHEAGAVDGIDGGEHTAGEETELQELGDGLILGGFWREGWGTEQTGRGEEREESN